MKIVGRCWYCDQATDYCILVKREDFLVVACRKCAHPADMRFWQAYFVEQLEKLP